MIKPDTGVFDTESYSGYIEQQIKQIWGETMEEVKCYFCHTVTDKVFWEENGYKGRKCDQCGLIYISPRPTEAEMTILYEQGMAGGASAEEQIANRYIKDLNAGYTMGFILKYKQKGRILEIGPGGGQFLQAARKLNFEPYAVEINRKQADYLAQELHIPAENCSASSPDFFKIQMFDVIYHKDLLSHLHNPLEVLRNLNDKLADDGIMVFETGNVGDLSCRWINFLGRLSYPEHVYLFSRQNILDLLRFSGFVCVESHYHTTVLSAVFWKLFFNLKGFIHYAKQIKKGFGSKPVIPGQPAGKKFSKRRDYTLFQKLKDFIPHSLAYRLSRRFPHSWPSTIIFIVRKS